jgi:hypothetical protein
MKYEELCLYLSNPRFERYFIASNLNEKRAILIYKENLKVAQSFYPLISFFEVVLRNKLNHELSNYFSDSNWIINQKSKMMSDPALTYFDKKKQIFIANDFLKKSIEKSEKRLNRLKLPMTCNHIIADMSFGFWTELYEIQHYKILKGRPIKIFENLPADIGRKEVSDRLNKIRILRNRISHNEPLCFNSTSLDFSGIQTNYLILQELFLWLNPELLNWMKDLNQIHQVIAKAKLI